MGQPITPIDTLPKSVREAIPRDKARAPVRAPSRSGEGREVRDTSQTLRAQTRMILEDMRREPGALLNRNYSPLDFPSERSAAYLYTNVKDFKVFKDCVNDDVYHQLVQDHSRMHELQGGIRQDVTVLFADIRGFTFMSDDMKPGKVVALLNVFMPEMIRIIRDKNKGYIDKIIGDAIMAYFGIPYPTDAAEKAVHAAIDMQRSIPQVNHTLQRKGLPRIAIGIGINSGEVSAGFVGVDEESRDFTIIGSTVNLASKFEGLAGRGTVLIGENTRQEVAGDFRVDSQPIVAVIKGEKGEIKRFNSYRLIY